MSGCSGRIRGRAAGRPDRQPAGGRVRRRSRRWPKPSSSWSMTSPGEALEPPRHDRAGVWLGFRVGRRRAPGPLAVEGGRVTRATFDCRRSRARPCRPAACGDHAGGDRGRALRTGAARARSGRRRSPERRVHRPDRRRTGPRDRHSGRPRTSAAAASGSSAPASTARFHQASTSSAPRWSVRV